jgi:hypothetical protein
MPLPAASEFGSNPPNFSRVVFDRSMHAFRDLRAKTRSTQEVGDLDLTSRNVMPTADLKDTIHNDGRGGDFATAGR